MVSVFPRQKSSLLSLHLTKHYWTPDLVTSKASTEYQVAQKGLICAAAQSNIYCNWENSPASSHHEASLIFYLFIHLWLKFSCTATAEENLSRVLRKWCSRCKQEADVAVRARARTAASAVLLFMLRAVTHRMKKGQKTNKDTSWRPPAGLESRARGSGSLRHPSRRWFIIVFMWAKGCRLRILQKEYVMHLSAFYPPKARQPFPSSLPSLSTVI